MPILLTNPFNPGDNNPGVTYPHAKIISQYHNSLYYYIRIELQFGTDDGYGNWQKGSGTPDRAYEISGQDYIDIALQAPVGQETLFSGIHRICYQFLIDKGYVAGTIV